MFARIVIKDSQKNQGFKSMKELTMELKCSNAINALSHLVQEQI